jgi:REP element-mobilizing transposase RayT
VFRAARRRRPFTIGVIVILPDHLHCIWTLPSGDADFSTRWQDSKARFAAQIPRGEKLSTRRLQKGERGIWQPRFWEHVIRDESDYAWYGQLTAQKIFFVTRQKSNARYRVISTRPVTASLGLVSDETILLTGAKARGCSKPLRRIVYRDPETGKVYVFLSNHFRLAAKTIAGIYQERWQIEIFCRWIKQNLKIKAFIGNSENAVMSQIYAALIVYLLLCYTQFLCNLGVTLMS